MVTFCWEVSKGGFGKAGNFSVCVCVCTYVDVQIYI